ncbi:hypothetical protein N802_01330 [Knoellia sinensis KCTC 19936]|uniref:Uncharacterized protein n=1 Tax=Knoellia sinensis KCTC 19936 TaxID=1385520 RepID=A0A0A0JD19_9MICO|nr:hypothetical protein [Knoellia sinensis]KGN35018.1 hypothetical protein N802_01330 [Knoellia sinensis KCTC 19936]
MSGEHVEYPTDYMNTLANTRQTRWATDSTEGIAKIRDALADKDSFGEIPALASYGTVFTEIRRIYLETMRGAKTDLEAVATGIRNSAQQMRDNDDQAGADFLALWQRWEQGPLDSTRNHTEAASTASAQQAAQVADTAETTPAQGGDVDAGVPTGDPAANPDTESEGAVPVTAETLPGDAGSTTVPDAGAGPSVSPFTLP